VAVIEDSLSVAVSLSLSLCLSLSFSFSLCLFLWLRLEIGYTTASKRWLSEPKIYRPFKWNTVYRRRRSNKVVNYVYPVTWKSWLEDNAVDCLDMERCLLLSKYLANSRLNLNVQLCYHWCLIIGLSNLPKRRISFLPVGFCFSAKMQW